MSIDVFTVTVSAGMFGIFMLIHLWACRRVKPEDLLKSLPLTFIGAATVSGLLLGAFACTNVITMPVSSWIVSVVLAYFVYGLACFVYVLCVFGPYETSVRMRLVRELAKAPSGGYTMKELLAQYGPNTIADIRLRRLKGAGDIVEEHGRFRAGKATNVFLMFDKVAHVLGKLMVPRQ